MPLKHRSSGTAPHCGEGPRRGGMGPLRSGFFGPGTHHSGAQSASVAPGAPTVGRIRCFLGVGAPPRHPLGRCSRAHSSSKPSRSHDSSAASGAAPSHLRLHRDKIRPLAAGAPPRSASEPFSPTPPGGRALLCSPLSYLVGSKFWSSPFLHGVVSGEHRHCQSHSSVPGLPRADSGVGFSPALQLSVKQRLQTSRGSFNLSLRVWNGLAF
ncbi:hypothetical protein NDU88_002750 [Pleurodeles waltl]|uniref:Uncharacterized protein n=1 Tax=Pleurodeles waltl TaxID=8319 RepID=A0AAV7M956_PLEWA|nr:hypothetical protein NDU88_002750 [Pleurodeles waltl]